MSCARPTRIIAALGVGLMVLLLFELPALAYPRVSAAAFSALDWPAPPVVDHGSAPVMTPVQIRRVVKLQTLASTAQGGAGDESGTWQPTVPEGAAFTIIGAGFLAGGGIVFGVGLAGLLAVINEANGLVTAAVGPLVSVGVGLMFLITGVAFLVHGVHVLKAARAAEQVALWRATLPAPGQWRSHELAAVHTGTLFDIRF